MKNAVVYLATLSFSFSFFKIEWARKVCLLSGRDLDKLRQQTSADFEGRMFQAEQKSVTDWATWLTWKTVLPVILG